MKSVGVTFEAPRPSFGTRFVQNMGDVVRGFLPGMFEIAKAGVGDVGRGVGELATLGNIDTDYRSPELAGMMARGFLEQSFIPALATGHPKEAWTRFSDRPFEGLLDLSTLGFGGYGLGSKAALAGAKTGLLSPKAARFAGYRPLKDVDPGSPILALDELMPDRPDVAAFHMLPSFTAGGMKYKTPELIGGELWTRPIARKIELPKTADSDVPVADISVFRNRSGNEAAARIGDTVERLWTKHFGASDRFYGNEARISRKYRVQKMKMAFFGRDDWTIRHAKAVKDYRTAVTARLAELGVPDSDVETIVQAIPTFKQQGINTADQWIQLRKDMIRLMPERIKDARRRFDEAKANLDNARADLEVLRNGPHSDDQLLNAKKNIEVLHSKMSGIENDLSTYDSHYMSATNQGKRDYVMSKKLKDRMNVVLRNRDIINNELMSDDLRKLISVIKEIDDESRYLYKNNQPLPDITELELNRYRTPKWVYGRGYLDGPRLEDDWNISWADGTVESPLFFSHKPEVDKKYSRTADPKAQLTMRERSPGNPLELFLDGRERWDLDVPLDEYYRQHRDWADRSMIKELFNSETQTFTRDEIKGFDGARDIAFADPRTGAKDFVDKPFVAVPVYGEVSKKIYNIQKFMEERLDELGKLGDEHLQYMATKLKQLTPLLSNDRAINIIGGVTSPDMPSISRLRRLEEVGKLEDTYRIVPAKVYDAIQNEVLRSDNMILKMIEKPMLVWKSLVLHLRPKWIVNNAVGSFLLLAMSEGFGDAVRLMLKTSKTRQKLGRAMYGNDEWTKRMKSQGLIINTPEGEMFIRDYIDNYAPEITSGSGSSAGLYRDRMLSNMRDPYWVKFQSLLNKIANFNGRWADDPARVAKAFAVMERKRADVENYMLAKGGERIVDENGIEGIQIGDRFIPTDQIYAQMLDRRTARRSGAPIKSQYADQVKREIVDETLADMIDFQNMTRREREIVRAIIPFYSWIKGATKIGARSVYEHPIRTRGIIATGELGTQVQDEELSKYLPSFLRGSAIAPEWMRERFGIDVLDTGSMNPWLTAADMAGLGIGLIPYAGSDLPLKGGDNPLSVMNPFLKAAIESATNRDVFFGTPIPHTGSPMETFLQRAVSVPIVNMLGNPFLYATGAETEFGQRKGVGTLFADKSPTATTEGTQLADILSYLGAPRGVRVNLGNAIRRGIEEQREAIVA